MGGLRQDEFVLVMTILANLPIHDEMQQLRFRVDGRTKEETIGGSGEAGE